MVALSLNTSDAEVFFKNQFEMQNDESFNHSAKIGAEDLILYADEGVLPYGISSAFNDFHSLFIYKFDKELKAIENISKNIINKLKIFQKNENKYIQLINSDFVRGYLIGVLEGYERSLRSGFDGTDKIKLMISMHEQILKISTDDAEKHVKAMLKIKSEQFYDGMKFGILEWACFVNDSTSKRNSLESFFITIVN